MVALVLAVALVSYSANDPSWSHLSSTALGSAAVDSAALQPNALATATNADSSATTALIVSGDDVSNLLGLRGAWLADVLYSFLGAASWWLVVIASVEAYRVWQANPQPMGAIRTLGYGFLIVASAALTGVLAQSWLAHGILGQVAAQGLVSLLTYWGALVFLCLFVGLASILTFDIPVARAYRRWFARQASSQATAQTDAGQAKQDITAEQTSQADIPLAKPDVANAAPVVHTAHDDLDPTQDHTTGGANPINAEQVLAQFLDETGFSDSQLGEQPDSNEGSRPFQPVNADAAANVKLTKRLDSQLQNEMIREQPAKTSRPSSTSVSSTDVPAPAKPALNIIAEAASEDATEVVLPTNDVTETNLLAEPSFTPVFAPQTHQAASTQAEPVGQPPANDPIQRDLGLDTAPSATEPSAIPHRASVSVVSDSPAQNSAADPAPTQSVAEILGLRHVAVADEASTAVLPTQEVLVKTPIQPKAAVLAASPTTEPTADIATDTTADNALNTALHTAPNKHTDTSGAQTLAEQVAAPADLQTASAMPAVLPATDHADALGSVPIMPDDAVISNSAAVSVHQRAVEIDSTLSNGLSSSAPASAEHDTTSNRQPSHAMQTAAYRASLPPLPELSLLELPDPDRKPSYSLEALQQLSELLEIKLQEFNVKATVVNAQLGPVVTRFEVELAAGVKVSKVTGIAKDLARSLSMASVRVVEVIPGKPYIGIEVPNPKRQMVRLIELLQTDAYRDPNALLSMAMGKDIAGKPVLTDLAKAPHMLVAGTTGSGKSVLVNSLLLSMLLKYTPTQLRLILIDPKQLELANYNDIPHLLTPVVTDMTEAASALSWCVGEMERRYQLMSLFKVRKLDEFNKKVIAAENEGQPLLDPLWRLHDSASQDKPPKLKPLPQIVVVADEFADMIMQVGKQAEELITRLAQKSRAAGIHLILATQRPSVDVITGLIKANIPVRAALRVNSKVDSRTILDAGGAEDMLGHGDMLFLGPGQNEPIRVHGAFISDAEVNRVCDAWRERGAPDYIDNMFDNFELSASGSSDSGGTGSLGDDDALYDEVVAFVMETRKVSASSIQRKFSIGYNRAARIVDAMEEAGLVSPMGKSGKRELLV